jgi:hypothetical protein
MNSSTALPSVPNKKANASSVASVFLFVAERVRLLRSHLARSAFGSQFNHPDKIVELFPASLGSFSAHSPISAV